MAPTNQPNHSRYTAALKLGKPCTRLGQGLWIPGG
jgi:hypothetical protein